MIALWQLFLVNLKIVYRNLQGLFFTVVMPTLLYVALSVLPIGRFANTGMPYAHYLMPGIIAMAVMQGGIYGLAYWMVDLKARGVLKRFMVTPVGRSSFIGGVLLSRIVVMYIQMILLALLAVLFFGYVLQVHIIAAFIFVLLGGSVFLLLGLVIASFADTYDAAAPLTSAIGLPLTFLGNIFYPVESLPSALQIIARILPMTHLSDGIRAAFLPPFVWQEQIGHMLILLIWALCVGGIAVWRFKLEVS